LGGNETEVDYAKLSSVKQGNKHAFGADSLGSKACCIAKIKGYQGII
jgi:hypothetical protein